MRVGTIREWLIQHVTETLRHGTARDVFLASDRVRVIAGALANHPDDEDVDLAHYTVDTAQAAQMLSYHAEHVRRLIRQGILQATKFGADYRIPLTEIFLLLVRRHGVGPAPDLLAAPGAPATTTPADKRDIELAIDVIVKRGPERQTVRLQRINVELGDLLRELGKSGAPPDLASEPQLSPPSSLGGNI